MQGKIKLGLEYIPPNGDGQQYVETSEDGDEDIDAKRSNDEITRTKDGPKVKKRRKTRRHLPRQWSDKEKDFQVSNSRDFWSCFIALQSLRENIV